MSAVGRYRILRGRHLGITAIILAFVGLSCWGVWHWRDPEKPLAGSVDVVPWRNVDPHVKYVGDAACVECHRARCDSFHQHPMGRSAAPVGGKIGTEGGGMLFTAFGLSYGVVERGGKIYHHETCRDLQGKTLFAHEQEVAYAVGSGHQGKSYLIDRSGFLFQSPISWFEQTGQWGASPGFGEKTLHFDRPITEQCLFCHSNRVAAVPHSVNHFRQPIFDGVAIGCERCHGPGELHVASRKRDEDAGAVDYTIVNPRHLEPALRDAVCEQCHLQGEARVLRRSRSLWD